MGDLSQEMAAAAEISRLLEPLTVPARERVLWHLMEAGGGPRPAPMPVAPAIASAPRPRIGAGQASRVGRGEPLPVPRPRRKVSHGPLKSKGPAVTATAHFVTERGRQALTTTQHDVAARFGLSISGADQRLAQAVQDGLISKIKPGVYGPPGVAPTDGAQANTPASAA